MATIVVNTRPGVFAPVEVDADAGAWSPTAADKYQYSTGAGTAVEGDITAAGRALLDDDDAAAQRATLGVHSFPPQGRLTLTSGEPVMTTTVTAAGTLYYTPYTGNVIWLYVGSTWVPRTFSEISIALSGGTASRPHDVFAYDNAGSVALELVAWTNDTTRATALARQDGVLIKNGAPTSLYLGTIYLNSSKHCYHRFGGDAAAGVNAVFWAWNYYNRVRVAGLVTCSTALWTGVSGTRVAGGYSDYSVYFVHGLAEDAAFARYTTLVNAGTGSSDYAFLGIGFDRTNGFDSSFTYHHPDAVYKSVVAEHSVITQGAHYMAAVEFSLATTATIWIYGGSYSRLTYDGLY